MDHAAETPDIVVTTDDPVVARVVRRVVEEVRPLRVILFGSRAKGTAGPDSDIDLLVVMPDGTERRAMMKHLYGRLGWADVSVDYLVTTPAVFSEDATSIGLIYSEIARTGRDVYVEA